MNNQLDLFEGRILTDVQRRMKKSYIEQCYKNNSKIKSQNISTKLLLDNAGFREGVDYINTFSYSTKIENIEFGYNYNNTNFKSEVEVERCSGGCQILHYTLRNDKITTNKSFVSVDGGKLQCTAITDQYRYYKPSSLLAKLKSHNTGIVEEEQKILKRLSVLEHTTLKYSKLYPEATILHREEYIDSGRRYTFSKMTLMYTLTVKFESGSYVTFRLGSENDEEYKIKSHDARSMNADQMLSYFNSQK